MLVRRSTQPSARGYTRAAGVPHAGRSPAQAKKSPVSATGSTRIRSTRVWQGTHRSPRSATGWLGACPAATDDDGLGCLQALLLASAHPGGSISRGWLTRRAAYAGRDTSYRQASSSWAKSRNHVCTKARGAGKGG